MLRKSKENEIRILKGAMNLKEVLSPILSVTNDAMGNTRSSNGGGYLTFGQKIKQQTV